VGLRDEPGYPDVAVFDGTPTRSYFDAWITFIDGLLERYGNVILAKMKSALIEAQKLDTAVAAAEAKRLELDAMNTTLARTTAAAEAATVVLQNKIDEYNAILNPAPPRGDT